jgi:Sulfotransferase family
MEGAPDDNSDLAGNQLFVVIGAQRTGTNLLREILNTNDQIAMLGEVLTPSPAPAHWDNYLRNLPVGDTHPVSAGQAEALLDRYFEFVRYRIRNYWEGDRKRRSHAFGIDIKYTQLRHIGPSSWESSCPFILSYLRSRGATIVHTMRNVIHSAISTLIASERNLWHNYNSAVIDRRYEIDVDECLARARTITWHRDAFLNSVKNNKVVNCHYESLIHDVERAGSGKQIPAGPGPLWNIAAALIAAFDFRNERRLQKAIDVPYSRLLTNYDDLIRRLENSEFSRLVPTLA